MKTTEHNGYLTRYLSQNWPKLETVRESFRKPLHTFPFCAQSLLKAFFTVQMCTSDFGQNRNVVRCKKYLMLKKLLQFSLNQRYSNGIYLNLNGVQKVFGQLCANLYAMLTCNQIWHRDTTPTHRHQMVWHGMAWNAEWNQTNLLFRWRAVCEMKIQTQAI